MVHAGAGATDDERNRGTLVNALLHRFRNLSEVGGELRPGIVHRLDKETSGLIVVAKNDACASQAGRTVFRPPGEEALRRAGAWLACQRSGDYQQRNQSRCGAAHPHDDAPQRRPHGGDALRGPRTHRRRRTESLRWSMCASRPAARTRYACTCRLSDIRWWAMRFMERQRNYGSIPCDPRNRQRRVRERAGP